MPNYKTRAVTDEELTLIIQVIKSGFKTSSEVQIQPNSRMATVITLQANLGLRVGDVLNLKLNDIIKDGNRYRLNILEQKTKKRREFSVPHEVYTYIQSYALEMGIKPHQKLFPISVRAVQKHLHLVTEHLRLNNVSTHSIRKYYAMSIYNASGHNAEIVRHLLQHSSIAVTQHYLSIQPEQIEEAISKHVKLI